MEIATLRSRFFREIGPFMLNLAHGGLLTAGFFALSFLVAGYVQNGRISIGVQDMALARAHAAASWRSDFPEPEDAVARAGKGEGDAPALSKEMARVKAFVAQRYKVSQLALTPLLSEAESAGRELGLDPLLLVAMIAIESSFNPFAESVVGAQGLMQVIPRFHQDKIGEDAGDDALFDPQTNIRVGALVLKEGLSRFGSLRSALQYYGGALKDPEARYAAKVLAMKNRLSQAARSGRAA